MITPKQAANAVKQKFPKYNVGSVFDYDATHYVVEATEKTNEPDFNAPYYAVEKTSGKVSFPRRERLRGAFLYCK